MRLNKVSCQSLTLFLNLLILSRKISSAQSVTAITQAPGFSSLSSCAQGVAKGVIDDSLSPECPQGSPPSCFCANEVMSKLWSDQILDNVRNNCISSPRVQAISATSVFAAYCSAGVEKGEAAVSSTVDQGLTSTAAAKGTTSTAAQNQATSTTGASPTTRSSQTSTDLSSTATVTPSESASTSSGGLSTSDKIAIGIGVPVGLATVFAAWIAWKTWKLHKKKKVTEPE